MRSGLVKIVVGFIIAGLVGFMFLIGFSYYTERQKEEVPVLIAMQEIPPRTLITEEMFKEGIIVVASRPKTMTPPNTFRSPEEVIGKYTITNYTVPQYSFLFHDKILYPEQIKDGAALLLEEGESMVAVEVNLKSSLAAQIVEGSFINLWLLAEDREDRKHIVGPFMEGVRVIGTFATSTQMANPTNTQRPSGVYEENEIPPALGQNVVPQAILLAVSNDEAGFIQIAEQLGKINVVGISDKGLGKKGSIFTVEETRKWMLDQLNKNTQEIALGGMTHENN